MPFQINMLQKVAYSYVIIKGNQLITWGYISATTMLSCYKVVSNFISAVGESRFQLLDEKMYVMLKSAFII